MSTKEQPDWEAHSVYKGCAIEQRPGRKRRGFAVRIPNQLGSARGGWQIHNSAEACRKNIDGRLRIYGKPTEPFTYINQLKGINYRD